MFLFRILPVTHSAEAIVMDGSKNRHLITQYEGSIRPVLDRFHLNLVNVQVTDVSRKKVEQPVINTAFSEKIERLFTAVNATTALATFFAGGYGEASKEKMQEMGKEEASRHKNIVKKYADGIATHAMHEGLFMMRKDLPENTVLLSTIGEGEIAKAGESQEMGSNPQLGFGRIYARPDVAKIVEPLVRRLINDRSYAQEDFFMELSAKGITVWSFASDPLEGTTEFVTGGVTGSTATMSIFNQPLIVRNKHEAYIQTLIMPKQVRDYLVKEGKLGSFTVQSTPQEVVNLLAEVFKVKPEQIHSWGLRGESRAHRVGVGESEYTQTGIHIISDSDVMPGGPQAVTSSGTMSPITLVAITSSETNPVKIYFIREYGASAESIMTMFKAHLQGFYENGQMLSKHYKLHTALEARVFAVEQPDLNDSQTRDASIETYMERLKKAAAGDPAFDQFNEKLAQSYANDREAAKQAGFPVGHPFSVTAFASNPQNFDGIALDSFISADAYSNSPGVQRLAEGVFQVTTRVYASTGIKDVVFTFKSQNSEKNLKKVFKPLLLRFRAEDYRKRGIKYYDPGRIKSELLENYGLGTTPKGDALIFDPNLFYEVKKDGKNIPANYFFKNGGDSVISKSDIIQNHPYSEIIHLMEILQWFKDNSGGTFDFIQIVPFNQKLAEILKQPG